MMARSISASAKLGSAAGHATLFLLSWLLPSCGAPGVVTPATGDAVTPATGGVVTPVQAWSLPEGCVSRFRPDSYGQVKEASPLLLRDLEALRGQVECRPQIEPTHDFGVEAIALFRFVSRGGSFKALGVEDDGKTVTLVVESTSYCGGAPPPMETESFFYRVPLRTRALATKVVPASQPPCSPYLP